MIEVDKAMIEDYSIELIQMMENAGRNLAHLARIRFLENDPRGKMKPWDKGAWETGKYRNVFLEAGYKQAEIDVKLAQAYHDLFEGPNRVYFEVGDV